MNLLNKYSKDFLIWLLLILGFFFLRLVNLTILPVFVDEAIYVRWTQILSSDPAQRFIPLSDGKQPLFMWVAAPFVKFLTFDPLFATRLVSVLGGFLGMIGIWFAAYELFGNKKVGYLASFLYAVIPFLVFYDRLAVVDGFLTAVGVWVFYLGILLVKTLRLDVSLILGMVLGAGLLTKSTAIFYVILFPFNLFIFDFKKKFWKIRIVKICGLYLISLSIAFVMYNILRLSPLFYLIGQRTGDFILTPKEALNDPIHRIAPRLITEIPLWLGQYLTWPVFVAGLFFLLYYLYKMKAPIWVLFCWFFIPLFAESAFAKGFTARYIVFTAPFLLLIFAYGLEALLANFLTSKKKVLVYLVPLLFIPALVFDFWLLMDPQKADIPQKERSGYLEEWSSGYGIKEIAAFLKSKPRNEEILVGTEGRFGTLPDGLQVYLRNSQRITVVGMGQPAFINDVPESLKNAAENGEPAYLIVNKSRLFKPAEDDPSLNLIKSFPKAEKPTGSRDQLLLFEVR
jgi:4-amino-4-deoxy-L-arabinose transferase-like glycosyltransferase